MHSDARINEILARHHYPQQPHYLLAALQDVQATLGHVPAAAFTALTQHFQADAHTAALLQPLFASQPAEAALMGVCTGPVCRRHGLFDTLASGHQHRITACDCLGLCDQAPAAIYRGEKIPHATVEILQRLLDTSA